ncbi:MAG: adenylyltransferase/cytidyltransferase family protein [Acetobacterium sp.]|uniref:adenylyltransferase/cytidyltransferase family protein n=1 Tax=Acetobacterium sp. TaxID=1872094 RepID=UPI003241D2E3
MKKCKVGYTTGVFDLFHIGHLNLLKRAKSQSDYLIVAVTTDEETFRIKNRKPIIPFEERIEIVRAIKYVDSAIPEFDTDKLTAWDKIKFDCIFKGDDWKGTAKWNNYEIEFKKRNVDVVYFDYTVGTSSTELREVIYKYLDGEF